MATKPITTRRALRLLTLSIPAAAAWTSPAAASLSLSFATRASRPARQHDIRKAPSLSTTFVRSLVMAARTALDEVFPLASQRGARFSNVVPAGNSHAQSMSTLSSRLEARVSSSARTPSFEIGCEQATAISRPRQDATTCVSWRLHEVLPDGAPFATLRHG